MKNIKSILLMLIALVAFTACDSNDATTGRASISITDAPIDDDNVQALFITILGIDVNGPNGWETITTFNEPVKIDILSYQEGDVYFLTEEVLEAGNYSELRLKLDAPVKDNGDASNPGTYILYHDGSIEPLFVPSGASSGYKAKGEFIIPAGGVVGLTLDFDVRKSVVKAGNSGKYILKPTIRLVADQNVGIIEGNFDAMDNSYQKVIVFAYADGTYTAQEIEEPGDESVRFSNAVTSAVVHDDNTFKLAFMNSGTYDLYFAEFDENGEFIALIGSQQDVSLAAGVRLSLEVNVEDLLN